MAFIALFTLIFDFFSHFGSEGYPSFLFPNTVSTAKWPEI